MAASGAKGRGALQVLQDREDRAIDTCTTCPTLCRWACPVAEAEARETTSPQRLAVLSGLLKSERATPEMASPLPYHCSHCGACTQACLHDNDVPLVLSLARSRLLAAGSAPHVVREVVGHFGVSGNPQGASLEPSLDAAVAETGLQKVRGGDTVYFPGCATLEGNPEAATGFLRAVTLAGLSDLSVRASSASCCGLPLFWAGEIEGFRGHAARFAAQFSGVKRLVVHDAACAHTLEVRYKDVGVNFEPEVVHVADYLAEGMGARGADAPSKGPAEARIAYADSCSAARGLQLVDAPRELIAKRLNKRVVELDEERGCDVDCCGASGLLPQTAPETAEAMAQTRLDAFRESGATTWVMASPRCVAHLKAVDPTAPIIDLATLLGRL